MAPDFGTVVCGGKCKDFDNDPAAASKSQIFRDFCSCNKAHWLCHLILYSDSCDLPDLIDKNN